MILQALVNHYENLAEQEKVDQEGWCKAKVSYAVNLLKDGKISGVFSLKTEEERGKKTVWIPQQIKVPEMVTRSSGISANFLCDNSKYILGIDADGTNQRVLDCFEAFLTALKRRRKSIWRCSVKQKVRWQRRSGDFSRHGIRKRHQNVLRLEKDGKNSQMEEI